MLWILTHTSYEKGDPYPNDANIPQAPKVGRVEKCSGVPKLPELFVCKSCNPYIQQDLDKGDVPSITLDQDNVV